MDLLIGSIASQSRIQWTTAFGTAEANLVPHRAFSQLLFGSEYGTAATWASLTWCCLDGRRVRIVEWFCVGNLLLAVH